MLGSYSNPQKIWQVFASAVKKKFWFWVLQSDVISDILMLF